VEHPDIDKIAFTGSTEVGRLIRKATAGTKKKLSLELGGKSPFVVFEDADLDSAVEGLVDAIWFNQGQVCCAGSRLLVQESISDKFVSRLKARMEKLRVGDPLDKAVDIGAIIAPVQLERIEQLVKLGKEEGAELFQPSWACPAEGWFYPPTLLSGVAPASTVAQVEIFGPVLVSMTFRTPSEAVELANNTRYGLAASVWSENLNIALDTAAKIKAGTVWVNCTNQFDAASGFGGFRESGYGREGGHEGLYEYVREPQVARQRVQEKFRASIGTIDRTHKLFIGGKQVRPDGGYSLNVSGHEIARGNRKDVRNAVEAAGAAAGAWAGSTAHLRAQILFYLAENLSAQGLEVAAAIVFEIAGLADKYEGSIHRVPRKALCYAQPEPIGVVGIVCGPEFLLADLLRAACAALAMGNTVVVIPPEEDPLPAAELYRLLEASDIPAGTFNIVTGLRGELVPTLSEHDDVDALWCFDLGSAKTVKSASIGNLKQTWATTDQAATRTMLRRATQIKNVWLPYGA
jgi:aldehyde dehydrogenase (NAD+)